MSELLRAHVGAKRESPPWREIKFKCSFHNTVYDVLKARRFKETDAEDWNLFWCDKEWIHDVFDKVHLQPHQRVNHFRNHYELTRKDLLVKNLKRAQRQAQKDGQLEEARCYAMCSPLTFNLPLEYSMFVEEFKKQPPGTVWIMKPVGSAQGKGIFMFNKLSEIAAWKSAPTWLRREAEDKKGGKPKEDEEEKKEVEQYVCQRYISDPLLIGGKKFDLRLYVLVTSYSPLTVYMYRGGFARFSHTRYSSDPEDISNAAVHLTNVAIQKQQDNYDEKRGGKWDLNCLKNYLMATDDEEKVHNCFCAIQDIILFSLLSVQKVMIQDKHCFEVYGYDVMITDDLKPLLIEVNASPSLSANTPADYDMKFALLDDTFTVLDCERYLCGDERQIGGYDLLYKNGERIGPPANAVYRSYLGCVNNRMLQLSRLSRAYGKEEERRRHNKEDTAARAVSAVDSRGPSMAFGKRREPSAANAPGKRVSDDRRDSRPPMR